MKKILLSIVALASFAVAKGQTTDELLKFSRFNYTFTTARSAAMGGAFVSLGADPAAMSINPAGLAMYRKSEVAITPSLLINNNQITANTGIASNNGSTKFAIPNISGVYSNGIFTLGLAYNRLADYSGTYTVTNAWQNSSITEAYAAQLQGIPWKNISSSGKDTYQAYYDHIPYYWNAIMGFQTGLVDAYGNDYYSAERSFSYMDGDVVSPTTTMNTSGAFNEFNISGAFNIKDIVYVGMTLGVPNLNYNEGYTYNEFGDSKNYGDLDELNYRQNLVMSGSGINFKVGVTVRPIDWLRIGVTYHSPNWITIYERSYNDMSVYKFNTPGSAFRDTPYLENNYTISTPSRLMAGASFTIAKRIIISADYERTWYKDMAFTSQINEFGLRMPNLSTIIDNEDNIIRNRDKNGNIDYKNMINNSYQTTNNYRVGVEAQPINGFFIRAGYNYSESPYSKNMLTNYSAQMQNNFETLSEADLKKAGEITQFTGGLGYRTGLFGIDLTYVYGKYGQLPTKNYYQYDGQYFIESKGVTKNTRELHQIMLSLLFKF